jgi:3-phenylpropionate/trans-cinnamate dioxygenase ferredoxin reductase subunit
MVDSPKRIVVIGGGLAGAKAVEALRSQGFTGTLTLIADEADLPYERPPLSKDYLQGAAPFEKAIVHSAEWYLEHDVDLKSGTAAMSVDRDAHQVTLADGATVGYDKLLLATGAIPRPLELPGADAVHYLRTHRDSDVLRAAFTEGTRVVIIGAGWIGLEVAASARERNVDVTVVESAKVPLSAAVGEEVGKVFAELHRDHGVDLRLDVEVKKVTTEDGKATGLELGDGSTITADRILIAVGAQPNSEIAERAGLSTEHGGVLVDASLCTSNPDIYAVGDIAAAENPFYEQRIRTEHWANAQKQPTVAVSGMLGDSGQYNELPYFFTDQYDLGMEYAGYAPDYQQVVFRGDKKARKFVAFWLNAEKHVLAGMQVNIWDALDDIKNLIRKKEPVDTDKLADPEVSLSDVFS